MTGWNCCPGRRYAGNVPEVGEQPDEVHPLTAGVTEVRTRHLGPYKACLRGGVSLAEAAQWAAELDQLDEKRDSE